MSAIYCATHSCETPCPVCEQQRRDAASRDSAELHRWKLLANSLADELERLKSEHAEMRQVLEQMPPYAVVGERYTPRHSDLVRTILAKLEAMHGPAPRADA